MALDRNPVKAKKWIGRPSGPWIITRKLVQYLALLIFILLFIWSRWGSWPANLVNIPMRLDPLLVLSHLLASRIFLKSSTLALLIIGLTIIFGRAWCGWICPLGTILDVFSLTRWRKGLHSTKQPGDSWRGVKYGLLLTTLFAAIFGNLTLLIFDPLTILFRTLAVSIWPAIDQIITTIEVTLYHLPFLAGPISTLDTWLRPEIFPPEPTYYRYTLLFTTVFLTIIGFNLITPRFWCRYLCPLGALLGLFSKLAIFRREIAEECKGCTLCTQVCPTGTIDPGRQYASDPSECTMCLDCLEVCPRSSIVVTPGISIAEWRHYDPNRRQSLMAFSVSIAALALFRSNALASHEPPHTLRPPGALENNLLSKCIRCAECMRACPTSALQPSIIESGVEGLWTPILIPRLGFCDYSCNACGQICPVQAIPPLALEEKRSQIIGKAYIDQYRCIAWADHRDCIVCEEMCPLPNKAIYLKMTEVSIGNGTAANVQLPYVNRDLCVGCGICEYKCPVNGEAAIRVYIPNSESLL